MKIFPFQLERFFSRYEFKAPYLLCTSDCESMTIQDVLSMEEGSLERFNKQWLGYTETEGSPELKNEIVKLYDNMDMSNIMVHSGAEEAIYNFMNAALENGDHVIVHFPCYQSLYEIANSIGCEVTLWKADEENDWELDVEFLKNNIRKNTKAIILNCPHNPTGYLMGRDKFLDIVEIARENNILLFSDEVYRYLEHTSEYRLPAACDVYENGVSLGVMSKSFGLAGLRIGWIATGNRDIFQRIACLKDYTTICSSAPSEFLSALALRHKEKLIERNINIVTNNIDVLNGFFSKYRDIFSWKAPKAGSIAFPRIKTDMDAEQFCIDLVDKAGVLLLPGNYYGYGSKNFRIGFGRKNVPECVEMLDNYINANYNFT